MIPYFIMVGIPAVLSVCLGNRAKKDRIVLDSFFLIWLLLLLFRSELCGIDLPVYKYHFTNYAALPWTILWKNIIEGHSEIAYIIICKIISCVTTEFRFVIMACALISVVPIWKLYRNEGKRGFLLIVLFLNIAPFAMYFSGLRQAMAMAFVYPCYESCKEKKVVRFLVFALLASLFHRSALILLLMYPLFHVHWKKKIHMLYLIPFIGVVYVLKVPLFTFLVSLLGGYAEEYAEGIRVTGAYAVTLLLAALLVYSFLIPDNRKLDKETMGLRNILVLCVFFQIFSGVHTIAMRMNYYYLLLIPLLIPRVIEKSDKKYGTIVQLSVICFICFFTFYYFYYAYTDIDILNVYPYVSMLKK